MPENFSSQSLNLKIFLGGLGLPPLIIYKIINDELDKTEIEYVLNSLKTKFDNNKEIKDIITDILLTAIKQNRILTKYENAIVMNVLMNMLKKLRENNMYQSLLTQIKNPEKIRELIENPPIENPIKNPISRFAPSPPAPSLPAHISLEEFFAYIRILIIIFVLILIYVGEAMKFRPRKSQRRRSKSAKKRRNLKSKSKKRSPKSRQR